MSDRYTDDEIAFIAATADDEHVEGSVARKLALEVKDRRAMVKRLEAWAMALDNDGPEDGGSYANIAFAAELRRRMGGDHG
jgi:hypothetical protein